MSRLRRRWFVRKGVLVNRVRMVFKLRAREVAQVGPRPTSEKATRSADLRQVNANALSIPDANGGCHASDRSSHAIHRLSHCLLQVDLFTWYCFDPAM